MKSPLLVVLTKEQRRELENIKFRGDGTKASRTLQAIIRNLKLVMGSKLGGFHQGPYDKICTLKDESYCCVKNTLLVNVKAEEVGNT